MKLTKEILLALCAATSVKYSARTKVDAPFMEDLIGKVGDLDDDAWEDLSADAQDFYNHCCDQLEAGEDLPLLSDEAEEKAPAKGRGRGKAKEEEPEEKPAAKGRGRGKAKEEEPEEEPEEAEGEEIDYADVSEGDEITVVCGDDEVTGVVESKTARQLVLKVGRKKETFKKSEIDTILGTPAEEEQEEEPEVATTESWEAISDLKDLSEGDEARFVLDGDEFEGKVVAIDKKGRKVVGITVEVDGAEEEISADDVLFDEGDTIEVKRVTEAKAEEPKAGRGRGRGRPADSEDVKEEKAAERKAKNTRGAKTNAAGAKKAGGRAPNATARTREMICNNMDSSKDEIAKMLDDEGVEIKASTLDIVYSDTHKTIECLRNAGVLE